MYNFLSLRKIITQILTQILIQIQIQKIIQIQIQILMLNVKHQCDFKSNTNTIFNSNINVSRETFLNINKKSHSYYGY